MAAFEQEGAGGVAQGLEQLLGSPRLEEVAKDLAAVDRLDGVFQLGEAGHQQADGPRMVLRAPIRAAARRSCAASSGRSGSMSMCALAKMACAASAESAVSTSNSVLSSAARVARMYGSSSTTRSEHDAWSRQGPRGGVPPPGAGDGRGRAKGFQMPFSTYSSLSRKMPNSEPASSAEPAGEASTLPPDLTGVLQRLAQRSFAEPRAGF